MPSLPPRISNQTWFEERLVAPNGRDMETLLIPLELRAFLFISQLRAGRGLERRGLASHPKAKMDRTYPGAQF